jgi:hypothetical protein
VSKTEWLVVVGSGLNVGAAVLAFATGNNAAGVVLLLAASAWLGWVFWKDRG